MTKRRYLAPAALISTVIALALPANGQTNTFPSSGNVGIGTTSPTQALTVYGNIQLDGGSRQVLLGNDQGILDDGFANLKLLSEYDIYFSPNNGSEAMRITAGGYVGIGTTAPASLLDVHGTGSYEAGLTVCNTSNIGVDSGFTLGTVPKATASSGSQGAIQIISNDSSNQLQGQITLVTDPTGGNRRLSIQAIEQSVAFRNVTLAENGGNVGIGTTNPT